MAEDTVTLNGYAHDVEAVHKPAKPLPESWNENSEVHLFLHLVKNNLSICFPP